MHTLTEQPVSRRLVTKPREARANTALLQRSRPTRTLPAPGLAAGRFPFHPTLQAVVHKLVGLHGVLDYSDSYKASAKIFITQKIDIIVLRDRELQKIICRTKKEKKKKRIQQSIIKHQNITKLSLQETASQRRTPE